MSAELQQEGLPFFFDRVKDRVKNRLRIKTGSIDEFIAAVKNNECTTVDAQIQETMVYHRLFGLARLPDSLRITYRYGTRYSSQTVRGRQITYDEMYEEYPSIIRYHHTYILARSVLTAQHRLLRVRHALPNVAHTLSVSVAGQEKPPDLEALADYARTYHIVPFPVKG